MLNNKRLLVIVIISFLLSTTIFSQNTALHFDSLATHVQTTYPGISGGTQARTIEAWIKTTSNFNPSNGGKQGVIADYGSFVTGGRFTFNILWSNAIRLEVGGNGLSGTIAVNDGNWHHVAVVYDPSATNKYSLYVDSVLDVAGNLSVTTNIGSVVDFRIGKRIDGAGGFRGEIDEVRFYNYARTLAQVGSERNDEYCTLPAGLTAYYKFNEGIAGGINTGNTTAINYAGNQDGTLIGFLLTGSTRNYSTGPALTPGLSKSINSISTCGTFTSPSGKVFSATGIYYDTLVNSVSCDSMVKYDITVTSSIITQTISDSGCISYTTQLGNVITSSGTYYDTLSTSVGCDSLIAYNLVITSIDDSVRKNGIQLISMDTWASHQWIDCNQGNTPISGATTRNYTPNYTGDYACIVTKGNCSDTTDCVNVIRNTSGIAEVNKATASIFPNPANDNIKITSNSKIVSVEIMDVTGKVVLVNTSNDSNIDITTIPSGAYIARIYTVNGIVNSKFIKE